MEGRLLLKDCALLGPGGRVRAEMAVVIDGARVREVRPDAEVPVRPGDWEVACRGRLVTVGLTDCHAHLVNGASPLAELSRTSAQERLELQRSRDARQTRGSVEALSADAMARALRAGVTCVVEHLHAPAAGTLDALATTAERLGLRVLASHASSSRDGEREALRTLEENAEFVRAHAEHPLVRGALGLDAPVACSDALLARAAELKGQARLVVECPAAELDANAIARLARVGLLDASLIAAVRGVPQAHDADLLARSGALVVWSPADPDTPEFAQLESATRFALGSSGGPLREQIFAATTALVRHAREGGPIDPDEAIARLLVDAPAELVGSVFGVRAGAIEPGALADLVVHDFVPSERAQPWSEAAPVAWTIVNGRVCVREGALLGLDPVELSREAARARASLR